MGGGERGGERERDRERERERERKRERESFEELINNFSKELVELQGSALENFVARAFICSCIEARRLKVYLLC